MEFTFDKSRIINFTDAVFSIAMTLLVLEIAIPSYQTISTRGIIDALSDLTPNFIGLVVSFFVIALFWLSHLRDTKYIDKFDNSLVWTNLFLLLFVILLPFSTALLVKGIDLSGPFEFYCFNISLLAFFNLLLKHKIFKQAQNQTPELKIIGKWEKTKAINVLIIWIASGLLAKALPNIARSLFLLIFVFEFIGNRYFKKKLKAL